jgi:polyisoprenoid-binding protein YceI
MKQSLQIDPAHSSAHFVVRHMMITNVRGSFGGVKGTVNYDPENPGQTTIETTIDAATVNTMDAQRDAHLRSADFLDVEKFPAITFKSTRVEPAGDGEAKITGDLTLHGVTRPVVLHAEGPIAGGKDPFGNVRFGASATGKIKRSDFGLTWNAALETGGILVGDDLKIELEVSLIEPASAVTA